MPSTSTQTPPNRYKELFENAQILEHLRSSGKAKLIKLIEGYKEYLDTHDEKVGLIKEFVNTWDNGDLKKLRAEMRRIHKLVRVDEEVVTLQLELDRELEELLEHDIYSRIEEHLSRLFIHLEKLRKILKKQEKFFEKTKERLWYEFHYKDELISLLREEADILFGEKLSGKPETLRDVLHDLIDWIEGRLDQEAIGLKNVEARKKLQEEGARVVNLLSRKKQAYKKAIEILSHLEKKENRELLARALRGSYNLSEKDLIGAHLPKTPSDIWKKKYGIKAYPICVIIPWKKWSMIKSKRKNQKKIESLNGEAVPTDTYPFNLWGKIAMAAGHTKSNAETGAIHENLHIIFDHYSINPRQHILSEVFARQAEIEFGGDTWDKVAGELKATYGVKEYYAECFSRVMIYLDMHYSRSVVSHIILNCNGFYQLMQWLRKPFMQALRKLFSEPNSLLTLCNSSINQHYGFDEPAYQKEDFKGIYLSKEDEYKFKMGKDFSCEITIMIPSEVEAIIEKKLEEHNKGYGKEYGFLHFEEFTYIMPYSKRRDFLLNMIVKVNIKRAA